MLTLLLFLSLTLLFYSLFIGDFSKLASLKETLTRRGLQTAGAALFFICGSAIFQTPLAGFFWGIFGWMLPIWIMDFIQNNRNKKLQAIAKNFINSAAGLYSAGLMTKEVLATCTKQTPEPIAQEFKDMLAQNHYNPDTSFPEMLKNLSEKYKLPELKAYSSILAASEETGGPKAASQGLKKLARALRMRDKNLSERRKALHEPRIAATFVTIILLVGLAMNVTVAADLSQNTTGHLVLAIGSGLTVGIIFLAQKITQE